MIQHVCNHYSLLGLMKSEASTLKLYSPLTQREAAKWLSLLTHEERQITRAAYKSRGVCNIECIDTASVGSYLHHFSSTLRVVDDDLAVGESTNQKSFPKTQRSARNFTVGGMLTLVFMSMYH